MQVESPVGQSLVCAETGKSFVGAPDGCSVNYARGQNGEIFSDEGVDIREKRELLDRSKTFYCYISSDGWNATGWKGNTLGRVTWSKATSVRTMICGQMRSYNVRDVHGAMWFGRGAPGMCIALRPMKGDGK